eukprot:2452676-Heterocapsa_arctica.AAC.1
MPPNGFPRPRRTSDSFLCLAQAQVLPPARRAGIRQTTSDAPPHGVPRGLLAAGSRKPIGARSNH